jgi:hypothetical protein
MIARIPIAEFVQRSSEGALGGAVAGKDPIQLFSVEPRTASGCRKRPVDLADPGCTKCLCRCAAALSVQVVSEELPNRFVVTVVESL